jgi:microcystin-dependent protein
MQIEQPDQGTYLMPIAWYWAPDGAKTYYGESAFSPGIWDPEKKTLPVQLGEQPPYASPIYDGANIWGYVGQCVIGTPQQFAQGLTAADLAAIPAGIPACCAPARTGQQWFLRHNLKPPQSIVPGVVVNADWSNAGDPISAGLLSDLPGVAPEGPSFTWPPPVTNRLFPTALVQYLTPPLPAQTISSQQWRLTLGRVYSEGTANAAVVGWSLSAIDGATGLKKADLVGTTIGPPPHTVPGPHGDAKIVAVPQVDLQFRDYLCLEVGLTVGFSPFHAVNLTLQIVDSGTTPIPDGGGVITSPMSVLQYPPTPVDPDMALPGMIVPFAGPAVPAGYVLCDGSIYSAAAFPALFLAIGTTWGVGGAGTFAVPDLRDRAVIGTSPGALSPTRPSVRNLADVAGEETHQLTAAELAGHAHTVTDPGHTHAPPLGFNNWFYSDPVSATLAFGVDMNVNLNSITDTVPTGLTVDEAGGNQPHNNVQPCAVVQWIIKF